jgi:hypothetical protein
MGRATPNDERPKDKAGFFPNAFTLSRSDILWTKDFWLQTNGK